MPVDVDELVEEVLTNHIQAGIVRYFRPVLPEDHRELEFPAIVTEHSLTSIEKYLHV